MKILTPIFLLASFFAITPFIGLAQDCSDSGLGDEYCLLAPLPGMGETLDPDQSSLADYLTTLYQSGVGIAIALAVVSLIVGGLVYMTSESVGGKSGGRERITAAVVGLVLALASFVLITFISGPGALSLDFSVANTNPLPEVPPDDDDNNDDHSDLPEGAFCSSRITITETKGKARAIGEIGNIPRCPGVSFWDDLGSDFTGVIDVELTEQQLIDYFERDRYHLSDECYINADIGSSVKIGDIDMSQCQAEADNVDLLNPGTPQACFPVVKNHVSLDEKEIFCDDGERVKDDREALSDYERIAFKIDTEGAPFDEAGSACYQLTRDEVVSFAAARKCTEEGGEIRGRFDNYPQLYGTYCVVETTEEDCEGITEFSLEHLGDEGWDNSCDSRTNFTYAFSEHGEQYMAALEDLYDGFTNDLGGHSRQTSGYYLDEDYIEITHSQGNNPEKKAHAGIDLAASTGDDIATPVAGTVVELWPENDDDYTNNGKVGVIDTQGRLWVFTHVMNMENLDMSVPAGTKIAEVGEAPGGSHIHIEVHNDARMAHDDGDDDTPDPTTPYSSLRGGLHSGQLTVNQAKQYTMCPLQAYWEVQENS